ncbi:hypothetical protein D9M71_649280 [compost metagenome]
MAQLLDLLVVEPGDFLEAIAHQCTKVGAGHFFDQRCCQGGHMRLALKRARVGFFGQLLEKVVGQRLGMLVDAGAERVSAFGADQGVRVLAFGQEQEACFAAVLQARKCRLQCPPCRIAAGLVAVEAE